MYTKPFKRTNTVKHEAFGFQPKVLPRSRSLALGDPVRKESRWFGFYIFLGFGAKGNKSVHWSVILLYIGHRFVVLLLHTLENRQTQSLILLLHFLRILLILNLLLLNLRQPVIIMPHRLMIIRLQVQRLRSPYLNIPIHKLRSIIIINCCVRILFLIEFYECKTTVFICYMIDGDLNLFYMTEGIEECVQGFRCDCLGEIPDVYCALVGVVFELYVTHLF